MRRKLAVLGLVLALFALMGLDCDLRGQDQGLYGASGPFYPGIYVPPLY